MSPNPWKLTFVVLLLLAAGFAALAVSASTAPKPALSPAPEETAGQIRSTMTMEELVASTGVPREYIVQYLNLPGCVGADKSKPAREWLSRHGLTLTDLREAVERYRSGHRF